jgi:hypothetical protein
MAYKRDYGKLLDERTARALIDAMSTTKRGPIGTAVVGTFKGQDVRFDLPGGITVKESSGFVDYYKQAKKALDTNPKQKVKVKFKDDGSYTFTTPGIPATTSSRLDSSSVPKQSAKSAASQAEMFTALEEIQAKIAALTHGLETGSFEAGAADLARQKINDLKEKVVTIQTAIKDAPVPKNSPLDAAATLKLERMRQLERAQNMNLDQAERESARAQVKALDRRIKSNERATAVTIPASEEDITAVVLGQTAEPEQTVEPEQTDEPEVPLKRKVKPTRTLSREEAEAGPSSRPSRQSAPATPAAVEQLVEALANPEVAAVVEQAQENAPVSTSRTKDIYLTKANMQKIAKEKKRLEELAEQKAIRDRGQARLKEERAKDAELEGRPRRTAEQDFAEREAIGQSSREEGAKFLQMAKEATDRQEAATRVAAKIAAPTPFVALQRKQREKTTAKKIASAKDYTSKLKALRAQPPRDIQDLAMLAEQGDTSVPLTREERIERRHEKAMRERAVNETERARIKEIERLEQEAIDQKRALDEEEALKQAMIDKAIQDQLAEDAAAEARLAEYDRAEYERRVPERAATKIQSLVRGRKGREVARLAGYDRDDAARFTREQQEQLAEDAAADARLAEYERAENERRLLRERLEEYDRAENERRVPESAATKIQSLVRGRKGREVARLAKYDRDDAARFAREQQEQLAEDAAADARLAEYDRVENERRSQRDSALKIQSLVRGRKGREVARLAKYDRDDAARFAREQQEQLAEDAAADARLAEYERAENARRAQMERDQANEAFDALVQEDAATKIQRALRERAARRAASQIVVPGTDIRPNDRAVVVPDTERMARALQEAGYTQMKRSYESLPENPETGKLLGFKREVPRAYDTARLPIAFKRAGEDYIPVDVIAESERGPAFRAEVDPDLADRIRRRNEETERLLQETTGSGLVGGSRDRHFVGGVLRRLRGMGFFDGFDSLSYNIHGTPDDNKKDLADAKAAYAAKGGAMGGSVVLSGVPAPMTGGYPIGVGADSDEYKLHYVAFPDDKWTTSSSLRWLRSNGIVPIKKAMHIPEYYKYQIMPPSDNKDYVGHELVSRGRKILLGYARPSR